LTFYCGKCHGQKNDEIKLILVRKILYKAMKTKKNEKKNRTKELKEKVDKLILLHSKDKRVSNTLSWSWD